MPLPPVNELNPYRYRDNEFLSSFGIESNPQNNTDLSLIPQGGISYSYGIHSYTLGRSTYSRSPHFTEILNQYRDRDQRNTQEEENNTTERAISVPIPRSFPTAIPPPIFRPRNISDVDRGVVYVGGEVLYSDNNSEYIHIPTYDWYTGYNNNSRNDTISYNDMIDQDNNNNNSRNDTISYDAILNRLNDMLNQDFQFEENVPIPLKQNYLSMISITKYNTLDNDKYTRCSICLCDFESDEDIRNLPCEHLYHTECIDKWFVQNVNCPMCRCDMRDLIKIENVDVNSINGEAKELIPMDRISYAPSYSSLIGQIEENNTLVINLPSINNGNDIMELRSDDIDERDIELVMNQANTNRSIAINALKNNNNDIIEAIMDLTVENDDIDELDIKLVMNQAAVNRSIAIRALKKNNNDIVNAIMELTCNDESDDIDRSVLPQKTVSPTIRVEFEHPFLSSPEGTARFASIEDVD